jgi:hypothetical protein
MWTMRRRLYFLVPDLDSAKRTADDLLLARVEDRHMRFLARRGTDLGELHEAGYLEKTDLVHGAGVGLLAGGAVGMVVGALVLAYPPEGMRPELVSVLIGMMIGGALGAWMASMAAAAVPNSRLKQFAAEIDGGGILLMVDVPHRRVEEISRVVTSRHPEATPRGEAQRYVFP